MNEKEKIIKEVLWLGIELIEDDFAEVDLTIKEIRKYIKNGGKRK